MKFKFKKLLPIAVFLILTEINVSHAQLGGLLGQAKDIASAQGGKALGIDKILKGKEPITTKFEDVDRKGEKMPDFENNATYLPLTSLEKRAQSGYVLKAGHYEITNKSYCLHAGTYGPSKGDGYMYAPTLGKKKDVVIAILKSAELHPEVAQHDIQVLLWAIIARTKFADMSGQVKMTAMTLLTQKQILSLEGGALGVLPVDVMSEAKSKLPDGAQAVFQAENDIRGSIASGNYSYQKIENYAILAGMAPVRSDVPRGIWTLHPDGYYIRYFPSGYSITKVQIYVPDALMSKGKEIIYDATDDIACPANTGAQRLAQTNEPIKNK